MKNEEITTISYNRIWIIHFYHRTLYQHSRQGECIKHDYKHFVLPQSTKIRSMNRYDKQSGYAPNASVTSLENCQVTGKLGKDTSSILYDLVDLEQIFKVTKRTLFNWRAKGFISFVNFGGKLYMTHEMLMAYIEARKEGVC